MWWLDTILLVLFICLEKPVVVKTLDYRFYILGGIGPRPYRHKKPTQIEKNHSLTKITMYYLILMRSNQHQHIKLWSDKKSNWSSCCQGITNHTHPYRHNHSTKLALIVSILILPYTPPQSFPKNKFTSHQNELQSKLDLNFFWRKCDWCSSCKATAIYWHPGIFYIQFISEEFVFRSSQWKH